MGRISVPKLKRTATFHEFLDDTGRRWVVRLAHGMAVGVVETALARERIEWRREWGVYRPLSEGTAERLVDEFCRKQAKRQPIERINGELLHPSRRDACACSDDRQLPAGDRT